MTNEERIQALEQEVAELNRGACSAAKCRGFKGVNYTSI